MEENTLKRIYPSLETINSPEVTTLTLEELQQQVDKSKQKDRVMYMLNKQQELKQKINHYQKIREKWIISRRALQGIGIASTVSVGIIAITTTAFIVPPILPVILTGGGIGILTIFSTVDKTLFNKKVKSLRNKKLKIKEILDKLHYYFEKAREDNTITTEEIDTFNKIASKTYFNKPEINNDFLGEIIAVLKKHSRKSTKILSTEKISINWFCCIKILN